MRGTPRFPAPHHLSPLSPPDRDGRVDSPALSARGSRPSPRTSDEAVSRRNSRCSLDGGSTCRKTAISRSALDKNPMPRHLFEDSVDKRTTRRGTDTPMHRPEKTAGYSYSSTSACHPVNNSRGKRRSIPAHKMRPDSPLPTMQGRCDWNQKCRGTLRFLPTLVMRPSSISPNPVESREVLPNSTVSLTSQRHPENLPEITGKSLGIPGILVATRERP